MENQPAKKKCPFCAEEISYEALKCKHCGEWLNRPPVSQQYSNAQALWKPILLSISTFFIYNLYWFYRNWKHLKIHKNLDISPGWRAVGLFVPVYGIFLIYEQFKDIRDFALQAGCKAYSSPGGITLGYIVLGGISFSLTSWEWSPTGDLLSITIFILDILINLIALWLLIIVQKTLNDYWIKEQPQLKMRRGFSNSEIALLIIGGIFWIFVLIGIFLPVSEDSAINMQL